MSHHSTCTFILGHFRISPPAQGGLFFSDFFLLFVGLAIVGTGIYGALMRDKDACRLYGGIMLMYSFVLGMIALLTALQAPVLDSAVDSVPKEDADCREIVRMMASETRWMALWFGLNCALDCAGAVYAIQALEYFDYDELDSRNQATYETWM